VEDLPWKGNNPVPLSYSKTTSFEHWKYQELMDAQEAPLFNWSIHLKKGSTPQRRSSFNQG
jgi:hypothetical protein